MVGDKVEGLYKPLRVAEVTCDLIRILDMSASLVESKRMFSLKGNTFSTQITWHEIYIWLFLGSK